MQMVGLAEQARIGCLVRCCPTTFNLHKTLWLFPHVGQVNTERGSKIWVKSMLPYLLPMDIFK